jgi:hypothetical protein
MCPWLVSVNIYEVSPEILLRLLSLVVLVLGIFSALFKVLDIPLVSKLYGCAQRFYCVFPAAYMITQLSL